MGLTARQQRILDGISGALQARDPQLVGMFSTFARLNRNEPLPWREQLVPGPLMRAAGGMRLTCAPRPRLLALVFTPVLLALIACLLLASPLGGGQRGCGSMLGIHALQLAGQAECSAPPAGSSAPLWPALRDPLISR